jgi:hypothetical protein
MHAIVVLYVLNYLQIDYTCLKWSIGFGPPTLMPSVIALPMMVTMKSQME